MSSSDEQISQPVKKIGSHYAEVLRTEAVENGQHHEPPPPQALPRKIKELMRSSLIKKSPKPTPIKPSQLTEGIDSHGGDDQVGKVEADQSGRSANKKRRITLFKDNSKPSAVVDSLNSNSNHEKDDDDDVQINAAAKTNLKKARTKSNHDDKHEAKDLNSDRPSQGEIQLQSQASTISDKTAKTKRESLPQHKDEDHVKKSKTSSAPCESKKESKNISSEKQPVLNLQKNSHDPNPQGVISMVKAKTVEPRMDLDAEVNEPTINTVAQEKESPAKRVAITPKSKIAEKRRENVGIHQAKQKVTNPWSSDEEEEVQDEVQGVQEAVQNRLAELEANTANLVAELQKMIPGRKIAEAKELKRKLRKKWEEGKAEIAEEMQKMA